ESKSRFLFDKATTWKKEVEQLRSIILNCGLTEELKWGCPCYTHNNTNVVLIHSFKEYCAVLFFKGALLNDPKGLLIQQSQNVQSARQMRFTDLKEITKQQRNLTAYIYEAIEVENAGLKVTLKKTSEYSIPEEFQKRLAKKAALKKAFESLTPGRQRAYLLYFSSAKQQKTREERIEKYIPKIMEGKGLND
ncbi:MAG: DUF1801 domain-containing protein, partial [Chitinophagaceae bacterium]